jgi:tellurite resistance protein
MSSENPITGRRSDFTFVSRLGPRTRDAMIAAAAEMALADGRAEPAEHRGLLMFLKKNNLLFLLGRTETTKRYTAEIGRATERHAASSPHPTSSEDRWHDLTARVRPIAGMESARLVAAAAACVAAADGVVHAGELELLRSLRDVLGLDDASTDARS